MDRGLQQWLSVDARKDVWVFQSFHVVVLEAQVDAKYR